MLKNLGAKTKKCISILALACFACGPASYIAAAAPSASAASLNTLNSGIEYSRDNDWERNHPDWQRRHKKDDGKDYNKGNIVTAVLVGGVLGAVIAKNT